MSGNMATKNPHGDPDLLVGVGGTPRWRLGEEDSATERAEFARVMRLFETQSRAGDRTAAAKAVRALWRRGWVQSWLADDIDKLTVRAMAEDEKRLRRKWHVHRTRWEALTELRGRRHELFARFKDDRGTSWERAREAVSEALKGTEAEGSPGAIKRSYEIVEAAGGERATFEDYLAVLRERGESDDD
jgi:hypothetical protein